MLSLTDNEKYISEKIDKDPYFNGDELVRTLHKAILSLPPKQRSVFTMRYFQEMKYEEISEILKISVGSLKASYHHAYKKIVNIIGELN